MDHAAGTKELISSPKPKVRELHGLPASLRRWYHYGFIAECFVIIDYFLNIDFSESLFIFAIIRKTDI